MIWYKELGFYNNPLSIKPGAFHDCLIGHEEIIGRIEANILNKRHSFVEGDYGEGKTQVLKRLINDFGGNKKVAYYNPSSGMFDIENLLKKRYGFFGRLFGLMPSDIVLLLDEAHTLLKPELQKLDTFIQDGNIKSVVLVGRKFEKMNIPEFLKSSDTFQLKSLSPDDAVKLVRKRVCSLHLLSDGVIKKIFEYSNENPRELLKNTEQILKRAYEHGEEKVTDEGIKAFFAGEPKKKVKEQVKEEKTKRAHR
ncbi:hypothetical protein HZB88_00345, partial [archaeon]|nr:hypothetical protein [archaeon]